MPKRGIQTSSKDDPNRKKIRQKSPDDAEVVQSKRSKSVPPSTWDASVGAPKPSAAAPIIATNSKKVSATTFAKSISPTVSDRLSFLDKLRFGITEKKAQDMNNTNERKDTTKPTTSAINTKDSTMKKSEVKTVIKKDPDTTEPDARVAFELRNKRGVMGRGLVAALGFLNLASLSYIVYEQSRYNNAQMRCRVENERLNADLSRNRGVVSVLKSALSAAENQIKFIEQVRESQKKAPNELREIRRGEAALSDEEKQKWLDKKELLRGKRDQLLDDFNLWLAKLDEVDGIE